MFRMTRLGPGSDSSSPLVIMQDVVSPQTHGSANVAHCTVTRLNGRANSFSYTLDGRRYEQESN
jgi:hypothetical protein